MDLLAREGCLEVQLMSLLLFIVLEVPLGQVFNQVQFKRDLPLEHLRVRVQFQSDASLFKFVDLHDVNFNRGLLWLRLWLWLRRLEHRLAQLDEWSVCHRSVLLTWLVVRDRKFKLFRRRNYLLVQVKSLQARHDDWLSQRGCLCRQQGLLGVRSRMAHGASGSTDSACVLVGGRLRDYNRGVQTYF